MANEKSFEVGGLQFTAIRKQIPVLHWVIRIDENGEVLEAGAGGISTESVPKMQASVHELFERVSKNDVADFRRRFGLPAQPLLTKVPISGENNQTEQSRERELIGHVILLFDSGWGLVHRKGSAESVFRKEREILDSIYGEDMTRRIPVLEGILARLVEAGWPHVNSPFVSDNAKKVFLKARDFVSSSATARFDESFAEVVEELRESHPDLEDGETVAGIKKNVRDDFQATGDALQDHLQLCGAVEKEIERVEFTNKLRM